MPIRGRQQKEIRICATGVFRSDRPRVQKRGPREVWNHHEQIGRSIIFLVRHVAAVASKTRKVDASATASKSENASIAKDTRGAGLVARSAQIRSAVSVRQGSLIH